MVSISTNTKKSFINLALKRSNETDNPSLPNIPKFLELKNSLLSKLSCVMEGILSITRMSGGQLLLETTKLGLRKMMDLQGF